MHPDQHCLPSPPTPAWPPAVGVRSLERPAGGSGGSAFLNRAQLTKLQPLGRAARGGLPAPRRLRIQLRAPLAAGSKAGLRAKLGGCGLSYGPREVQCRPGRGAEGFLWTSGCAPPPHPSLSIPAVTACATRAGGPVLAQGQSPRHIWSSCVRAPQGPLGQQRVGRESCLAHFTNEKTVKS